MHKPPKPKYAPDPHELGEYDLNLLEEARQRVMRVYTYHYGDSYMRTQIRRLETIINKIDSLTLQATRGKETKNDK